MKWHEMSPFERYPCFDLLPLELIRHVYSFADIPSLGAMIQTGNNFAAVEASCQFVWAELVKRRFRIETARTLPKFHGGRTWKEAYRSMARCNRLFKSRYTSKRKVVFAKNDRRRNSEENPAVSVWVMLGHTENCETRSVHGGEHRFIELCLCLQNVSSSFGTVCVDVMGTTLRVMGNRVDDHIRRIHVNGPLRPKLRLHDSGTDTASLEEVDLQNGITLKPLQVAVVSVNFPCSPDVFETDFLAKAVSLHVPVRMGTMPMMGQLEGTDVHNDQHAASRVSALFLPEKDVWNYYSELPGGCLTLTDRFLLVTA